MATQQSDITALARQGIALHQQGKFSEAQAVYIQVLRLQPNHFDALRLLGALASQHRQFSEAVGFFSKALHVNPTHAET